MPALVDVDEYQPKNSYYKLDGESNPWIPPTSADSKIPTESNNVLPVKPLEDDQGKI